MSERFAAQVREYNAFIARAHEYELDERLRIAREQVAAIYVAGLALPEYPEHETRVEVPNPETPATWPHFGMKDLYYEVFDPYIEAPLVCGELSDDLLDIYSDVGRGLALWDRGHTVAAVWDWRFHFDCHWGHHAVDALRALQRACPTMLG